MRPDAANLAPGERQENLGQGERIPTAGKEGNLPRNYALLKV